MVGGGMTPILAAGFTNVAATYHVTTPQVALTTGLYMMGLGVGSVFASPTAILYGKRPVYLVSAIIFILTSVWCALSPSYASLVVARVFQGISVSPVECLPSATVAEIFFLHERAYRLGIYTLLLLGGKNLVPLVSAAIIQSFGWRWVFWIVAMVVGFCGCLLFLFVPESFWDRSPVPKNRTASKKASKRSLFSLSRYNSPNRNLQNESEGEKVNSPADVSFPKRPTPALQRHNTRGLHVGFVAEEVTGSGNDSKTDGATDLHDEAAGASTQTGMAPFNMTTAHIPSFTERFGTARDRVEPVGGVPPTPNIRNFNSPYYNDIEAKAKDYFEAGIQKDDNHHESEMVIHHRRR